MPAFGDIVLEATRVAIRAASETANSTVSESSSSTMPQPSQETGGSSYNNSGNDTGNKDKGSSPLLFFVALGFGVVFTNLW